MTTQMEQIQQILSALLQKIPDAQQQQTNGNQEVATKEEVAKLSAEVKLLSEKFEEKYAMEKSLSQQSLESPPKQTLMQKLEEVEKIRVHYMGILDVLVKRNELEISGIDSGDNVPWDGLEFWRELYDKKVAEAKELMDDA